MASYTKIKRIHLSRMKDEKYIIDLKFNSFKDGDIVLDIIDNTGFEILEVPIIGDSRTHIKNEILNPLFKIMKFQNIPNNLDEKEIILEIWKAIFNCKKLLGKETIDYDIHNCQTMLKFGHFPKDRN